MHNATSPIVAYFRNRVAIRAYYAAQNDNYAQSAEHYWLEAERVEIETNLAAVQLKRSKRSEAAKRGAATRKRNKLAASLDAMAAFDSKVLNSLRMH